MKHAKKAKDKYYELIKRKTCRYTADNRPIEIYSKGKEKIYVAFDKDNNMEIVGHNPIPLLAGILGRKAISSSLGAVASSVLGTGKADEQPVVVKPYHKSLRDELIEKELYGVGVTRRKKRNGN